jgi:hypothetical protein
MKLVYSRHISDVETKWEMGSGSTKHLTFVSWNSLAAAQFPLAPLIRSFQLIRAFGMPTALP